jgi:hypothetical protein
MLFERKVLLVALTGCSLSQISCGGDGVTVPETKVATSIAASSSTSLTGTAGEPASPLPSVLVTDQHGAPIAGVTVTFTKTEGDGTLTGASQVTNVSGVATVGGWTLGKTAGPNALTASTGQLTPITFSAPGAAGAPALMVKTAGDGQTAIGGTSVITPPAVTVTDVNGNGVAGVAVAFRVGLGGGSATGQSATTDANGVARVGSWTLGLQGPNSLDASAQAVATATFTATGSDPCVGRQSYVGTVNGSLGSFDCRLPNGAWRDLFQTIIGPGSGGSFRVSLNSNFFDSYLYVLADDMTPVAEASALTSPSRTASVRVIGQSLTTYVLGASSAGADASGDYTLSETIVPINVTNCEEVFITSTVGMGQNLESTDCSDSSLYDKFTVYLKGGQTVTIDMTSMAFTTHLELLNSAGRVEATADGNASLVYTAPVNGYFVIHAGSAAANQTGPYGLFLH